MIASYFHPYNLYKQNKDVFVKGYMHEYKEATKQ